MSFNKNGQENFLFLERVRGCDVEDRILIKVLFLLTIPLQRNLIKSELQINFA